MIMSEHEELNNYITNGVGLPRDQVVELLVALLPHGHRDHGHTQLCARPQHLAYAASWVAVKNNFSWWRAIRVGVAGGRHVSSVGAGAVLVRCRQAAASVLSKSRAGRLHSFNGRVE